MNSIDSFPVVKLCASVRLAAVALLLLAVAGCKERPRYLVGDHLIPMGSSDATQIVTVVAVEHDGYKVSSAINPKPTDPVQTKTRREIESYYVRIDPPVGGSWLTEEDRAAALARLRNPTPVPSRAPSITPTPSVAIAQNTPTPTATPAASNVDVEALAPAIRPAMAMISTFDAKGKLLRNTTGFFIATDGRFVTTADATVGAANGIVKVQSGAIYNVVGVLASSTTANLAVLKVETASVPALTLSEATALQPGAGVLVADTIVRRRNDAIVPATIASVRNEPGGEAMELAATNLQVSAGSAVVDANGQVVGCVLRDESGPRVRSVRSVAALRSVVAQVTASSRPTWPVAQTTTPTPTPRASEAAVVYAPLPRYPANARYTFGPPPSGTGRYLVKFGADGRVISVSVVQTTNSTTLDNAAIETLKTWRVKPGAPSQRVVPITFHPPR